MRKLSFCLRVMMLLVLVPTVLSQGHVQHLLPTGLVFHSWYTGSLYYVDPATLEASNVLQFEDDEHPDGAFWSPDGQYLAVVFRRYEPGNFEDKICLYLQDWQRAQCTYTHLWGFLGFPILWEPEGEQILVLLETEDNLPQLGRIDVAANTVIAESLLPLSAQERLEYIYWSPTARYMAYETYPIEHEQDSIPPDNLYVFDIAEMESTFTMEIRYGCVSWSPDGEQIALILDDERTRITMVDTSGNIASEVIPLSEEDYILSCPMAWSHDGTKIAFTANEIAPDQRARLFFTEVSDGETHLLADNSITGNTIVWSPDDTHIATDIVLGGTYSEIFVVSIDGWERWYRGDSLTNPAWQPLRN